MPIITWMNCWLTHEHGAVNVQSTLWTHLATRAPLRYLVVVPMWGRVNRWKQDKGSQKNDELLFSTPAGCPASSNPRDGMWNPWIF